MLAMLHESVIFGGFILPILSKIKNIGSRSLVVRIIKAIMSRCGGLCSESGIKHLFSSESKTEAAFSRSIIFCVLSAVVNAVPRLLRKIYTTFENTLGESRSVSYIAALGSFTPAFLALTLLALLVVPFDYWNNMYTLVLAFLALLLLWLRNIRRAGDGLVRFDAVGLWSVVFAFVSLASALWSSDFEESLRFVFFSITCMLIVLTCASAIKSEKQLSGMLLVCAIGVIVCSLFAFYQRFIIKIPPSTSFTDLELNANMPGRVYSFFDNPNAFANVLVFFTPLMLMLGIYSPGRRKKTAFFMAFLLGICAMLMTYSRGAWFAFAVGAAVMIIIVKPRLIPVFIALFVVLLPFLPANILNRVFTIFGSSDSSINSRTYIYTAVYRIIRDNPLTGVGLGTTVLKSIADNYGYYAASFPFVHAHSIYMEIWAESGILAIISFALTMFFALKKGYRAAKSEKSTPVIKGAAVGCIGGIVGSLVFGITDYAWSYPRVMALFWFLVAITYAVNRISGAENENVYLK